MWSTVLPHPVLRRHLVLVLALLTGCISQAPHSEPDRAATSATRDFFDGAPPTECGSELLRGQLRSDSLDGQILGSRRAVSVYLPPSEASAGPLPVVFLVDGQMTKGLACRIDPLVVSGALAPVVLVGVHSSRSRGTGGSGTSGRAREYLIGRDAEAYAAHEAFFVETVIPRAESRLPISRDRAERALFGASNGASFATTLSRQRPSLFGSVIAFSHAVDGLGSAPEDMSAVRSYLMYGSQEAYVDENTESVAALVRSRGGTAVVDTWDGGHDGVSWEASFPSAVEWFVQPD